MLKHFLILFINADRFFNFFESFVSIFKKIFKPKRTLFLQDRGSLQNIVKVRCAWKEVISRKFTTPERCPDLNHIKSIYNIIKQRLYQDALNWELTLEKFVVFSTVIETGLKPIAIDVIDGTSFHGHKNKWSIKRLYKRDSELNTSFVFICK